MILITILMAVGFTLACLAYLLSKYQLTQLKHKFNTLKQLFDQTHEDLKALQNKLSDSTHDPLTHLLGRQLFEDRLLQRIKEGLRHQLTMGVLFVDIDDFKNINNALGKEVGDAVLREVGNRIQSSVRKVDSVSRFNKDVFVVLLSQLSKAEMAAFVALRILNALKEPITVNHQEVYVTASVGIAIFPTDGEDVITLLDHSYYALSQAKKQNKHSYQFYEENMHRDSERDLLLHTSISRQAVLQEFSLDYLPVKNNEDRIVGVEAILHWEHQEIGHIEPTEIISVAAKQDKLNDITEWMIHRGCETFLQYQRRNPQALFLIVPVWIKQFEDSHLIYRISHIMQALSFNPEWLILEIKDADHTISMEQLEKTFNMLKYLHLKVAIHHFGLDAFSLRCLKNFPIDCLSVGEFLIEDSEHEKAVVLIKTIAFMAKNLPIKVIIHGVKTQAQRDLLREAGLTLATGSLQQVLTETQLLETPPI